MIPRQLLEVVSQGSVHKSRNSKDYEHSALNARSASLGKTFVLLPQPAVSFFFLSFL